MEASLKKQLKSLSKDDESFEELRQLVGKLIKQKEHAKEHLQLLESVIENDYDSIMITELEIEEPGPEVIYVNKGFTKLTGYESEDIIGKTPRILQGPKTDRKVLDRLKERLRNGRPFYGQSINYKKDGTEFVNQWDIHPLTDAEGQITHWVSYQHDISKRKRAEQSFVNTQAEHSELWEQSKSTILDVGTDGYIVSSNKAFRNLTGYAKDELPGTPVWELFPRKYKNSLKGRFQKEFSKDDFDGNEYEGIIKSKKGLPIQVKGTASVIMLKDQTIIRANVRNISLQKRVMETLQKRNSNYDRIVTQANEFNYKALAADDDITLQFLSNEFSSITGLSGEEINREGGFKLFVHQDDLEKAEGHIRAVMNGNSGTCEYRIRQKDGSYTTVVDYAEKGTCIKGGHSKDCVRGSVTIKRQQEPVQSS